MAKPKPKQQRGQPSRKPPTARVVSPEAPLTRRRDLRVFIYAGLDLVFGVLYVILFMTVAVNRHAWAQGILYALPVAVVLMGAGTLVGGLVRSPRAARIGWIVAVASGALMLVVTVLLLALLLASAAFLSGVYGAFGKAAASGVLAGAALVVELVALLPAFQLKFLMTRGGRRAFGLQPLWRRAAVQPT